MRNFHRGKILGDRAFLERLSRGFGRAIGGVAAMQQRGRFCRQDLLGFVDLAALQRLKPRDLTHRQDREQLEELDDIGVFDVSPVLPEIVGAELVGVEPDRASGGLAHLFTRRCGEQRRRQRE